MMSMEHFSFYNKWHKIDLYVQQWSPPSQPVGQILIVHGQSDHSGRFAHVAEYFVQKGWRVSALDLQGHGRSTGKRGHVDQFKHYIEQVQAVLDNLKDIDAPLVLYGQSMGGLVVLQMAAQGAHGVQAFIASSPWLKLAFDPPAWRVSIGKLIGKIYPSFTQKAELDLGQLCHPEEVQRAYKEDPLVHGRISAAAFLGILEAGESLLDNPSGFKFPVLVMHGSADAITSCKASEAMANRHPELDFVKFQGLYHELHNENEKEEVLETAYKWMKNKCDQ